MRKTVFLRGIIQDTKNVKNFLKTFATRHQHMMAYHLSAPLFQIPHTGLTCHICSSCKFASGSTRFHQDKQPNQTQHIKGFCGWRIECSWHVCFCFCVISFKTFSELNELIKFYSVYVTRQDEINVASLSGSNQNWLDVGSLIQYMWEGFYSFAIHQAIMFAWFDLSYYNLCPVKCN